MSSNTLKANNTGLEPVFVTNGDGPSPVLLICEHASNYFPPHYHDLGLDAAARQSHAAWDPGALGVAKGLAAQLDATLVHGGVSRLIYDCNRPPEAPGAMPARSEVIDIPGNVNLSPAERDQRAAAIYFPFRDRVAATIASAPRPPVLVTIHSFTPIFMGKPRTVEIGVLHDTDTRLADAILSAAPKHTNLNVQRNVPYGAKDGVTHTLKIHGIENGLMNVMLEIRNDLIQTQTQQRDMASMLTSLLNEAIIELELTSPSVAAT